jgi:hypothetical protein
MVSELDIDCHLSFFGGRPDFRRFRNLEDVDSDPMSFRPRVSVLP